MGQAREGPACAWARSTRRARCSAGPTHSPSGALVTHDPAATPFAPCYGQNTSSIVHPDELVAQSFALLAVGDFPARPEVKTPAPLDDLAAVLADGAKHVPETRCRY